MDFGHKKAFTGFMVPANATGSSSSAFKNMDVNMKIATIPSTKANETTHSGNHLMSTNVTSVNKQGAFNESFEAGIEHQKFARVLESVQRRQRMSGEEVSFATILPQLDVLCSTRARLLENRKEVGASHQTFGAVEEYKLWQAEGHTWVLLTTLFSAFANNKPFVDKGSEALQWSDLDLVEHLASTDAEFKHHSAVKAWLEIIAPPFTPQIRAKNTQSSQAFAKPSFFSTSGQPKSTAFQDPDAISRDGFTPSEHNQKIEQELLKTVWEYVRRGNMQKAQETCRQAGEPWRADSIGGGQLCSVSIAFTDPQYDRSEAQIGNETRGLWKGTCYALAQDTSSSQFERAVYGALSGDVDTVIPVCSTWEDHAWARYNSLVEGLVEARLTQFNRGAPSKLLPIPKPTYTGAKDVFDSLTNSDNQALRAESKDMFREIQTSIILGTTDQLLVKMAQDAKSDGKAGAPLRPHMLRFLAHFVLLLRSTGSNVPQFAGDYFIKSYVDFLISKRMYDLAPLYISYLPYDLQITTCSSYLKTIDGTKGDRQNQLKMLREHGLDTRGILTATVDGLLGDHRVEFIKDGFSDNLKQMMTAQVSPQERAHIEALEWLSFDSTHFDECLHRSNYLTRKYLAQGRINAAFALYNSLPSEIVLHELQQSSLTYMAISNEHLYYRDLFTARLHFEEWKDALAMKPTIDASSSRKQIWERDFKDNAHRAVSEIETLLLTRWLSDCMIPGDTKRNLELMQLRQIYISELVINLHQVFYESRSVVPEYLEKSVEMANMVASETTAEPLYKELDDAHRLQEFLDRVRLSSIELLKDGRSPFAF